MESLVWKEFSSKEWKGMGTDMSSAYATTIIPEYGKYEHNCFI